MSILDRLLGWLKPQYKLLRRVQSDSDLPPPYSPDDHAALDTAGPESTTAAIRAVIQATVDTAVNKRQAMSDVCSAIQLFVTTLVALLDIQHGDECLQHFTTATVDAVEATLCVPSSAYLTALPIGRSAAIPGILRCTEYTGRGPSELCKKMNDSIIGSVAATLFIPLDSRAAVTALFVRIIKKMSADIEHSLLPWTVANSYEIYAWTIGQEILGHPVAFESRNALCWAEPSSLQLC